ncbi:uroporphyrinogen-III C-methyltransferase [Pelagibius litoralis]|uniref:uroporphyrinogen-III C-methyltransferase n=1 Tax=Pelagibius litoralis TaxID=374515 RepID=A0A967C2C5_9PROT|nr:uroporphyrinogen-III C-methyltransferase [Pelagibius litoralis]NIA69166.1 uroporphyrinogen-III C-methyltransferase [Pelagibius litoralis]
MNTTLKALPVFQPGTVWLVGAGPGDPGLLTLHAVNALQQADVLVYDALVGEAVLDLAPADCERIYAGKRGGRPSPVQADISQRLVRLAKEGKRVLRLKGGDPFVFGRGGEEALSLVAAGVPFRIVPGISAGIGGLAYAGIPVTHRDTNSAVTFLTGHGVGGEVPDGIDWAALAKGSPVIVLYMALKHIAAIAGALIEHGRSPSEPVAVVSQATLPAQTILETCLARCAEEVTAAGIEPPCIVVIGEVVRLRAGLDWQGAAEGRELDDDPLGLRHRRETG